MLTYGRPSLNVRSALHIADPVETDQSSMVFNSIRPNTLNNLNSVSGSAADTLVRGLIASRTASY